MRSFVSKHHELYGRWLPFYDVPDDEYYADEPHEEDLCVLIWYIVQLVCDDYIPLPDDAEVTQMAEIIYDLLDAEFEKAGICTFGNYRQAYEEKVANPNKSSLYIKKYSK